MSFQELTTQDAEDPEEENMKYKILCAAIVTVGLGAFLSYRPVSADVRNALDSPELQQTDPNSALTRGRTLLKQGHADQALGYLETALSLYTQANNPRGVAAAEDGLGDLYLIQGQYKVALDHYQKAYEAF